MRSLAICCVVSCAILVACPSGAVAQEQPGIPQEAIDALQFFVGSWESDDFEGDQPLGESTDTRKWAPGRCCITMSGSAIEKNKRIEYSGISGWDAKGKQLLEHWHSSDGMFITIRYPLSEMKDQVWSGTLTVVAGDGTQSDGTCTLEKTKIGFVFTARTTLDGKETVRRSVTRRVEREKE